MFCPDILALKHKSRIVTCQTLLGWPRTTHFSSLIFKPVFEHWTGGEAMPKNRKERQCWLSNTSQQCRRILLRCFRARTSGSAWAIHYQRDMCTYKRYQTCHVVRHFAVGWAALDLANARYSCCQIVAAERQMRELMRDFASVPLPRFTQKPCYATIVLQIFLQWKVPSYY